MNPSCDLTVLRRCFDLARLGSGKVGLNPRVGAVILFENRVLGEGYHQFFGGPHAEVNAIHSVKKCDLSLLSESTLYISLEPCNFYGKTPPCVELIEKYGFKKVVVSCLDPNSQVSGKSLARLRSQGIEVVEGVLKNEGNELLSGFRYIHEKKRPKVILKFAQSADGFIGQQHKSVWLSNPFSRRLVHKWRNEADAILIGTNTAAVDDPSLTTRFHFGKSPTRIILDRAERLPKNLNIFDGKTTTYLVTEDNLNTSKNKNIEIIPLPFDENLLINLLRNLLKKSIGTVIVEGGAQLIQSFIQLDLWDEARVFHTQKLLKTGIVAPVVPADKLERIVDVYNDKLHIFKNS